MRAKKATSLLDATRLKNARKVRSLLESGVDVNATDDNNDSPLHAAIGDEGLVTTLLSFGARTDIVNVSGHTPLSLSLENDETASFEVIVKHMLKGNPANHVRDESVLRKSLADTRLGEEVVANVNAILARVGRVSTVVTTRVRPGLVDAVVGGMASNTPMRTRDLPAHYIDIVVGLLYLATKHHAGALAPKANVQLHKMTRLYESLGYNAKGLVGFEVVWAPSALYTIGDFGKRVKSLVEGGCKHVVIPLAIELEDGSHANYLIYDVSKMELERFEPEGGVVTHDSHDLDLSLIKLFRNSVDTRVEYHPPSSYVPVLGPQALERREGGGDVDSCVTWCVWYADLRLSNPSTDRSKVIGDAINDIRERGMSFTKVVTDCREKMLRERASFLKSTGLRVGDLLNSGGRAEANIIRKRASELLQWTPT